MPEVTEDTAVLIAISWRARGRVIKGLPKTRIPNCAVMLLFAAIYIEASLNGIIEKMGKYDAMKAFVCRKHPGLQDKLGWFYNEFIESEEKALGREQLFEGDITGKLRKKFPGFGDLYTFRNELSHGKVGRIAARFDKARGLRDQAKDIVAELVRIAQDNGYEVERSISHDEAIEAMLRWADEQDAEG